MLLSSVSWPEGTVMAGLHLSEGQYTGSFQFITGK